MSTVMNKRKAWSIKGEVKVIRQIENVKISDIYQKFCLENSVIQTIFKNRTTIISAFEQNGSRIKQF
jgi:hypothetical protein